MSSIRVLRLWFSFVLQYPLPDCLGVFRMNCRVMIAFIAKIFDGADRLETRYGVGLSKFAGSPTGMGSKSGIPVAQRSLINFISSRGSTVSWLSSTSGIVVRTAVSGTIAHMGISG
jgi:hypothetical protein